jgi:hypothetical protein
VSTWNTGWPPQSGYYIATWTTEPSFGRGRNVVSELWFNRPDSQRPEGQWWPNRGYLSEIDRRGRSYEPLKGVIAWMPMPEPYTP